MLLTRYGHQKKLNSPTVRRRQFFSASRLLAQSGFGGSSGERSARRVLGSYLGWIFDLGMSRSPGCLCVV